MSYPDAPSARAQQLVPALLAVLTVSVLAAAGDVLASALPFRPGDFVWRYQLGGLILSSVPLMALSLAVLMGIALYGERYRALRAAAIVSLLLSVLLLVILPLFALDFLSARHLQPQSQLAAFQRTGLKVAGTGALLTPALGWAGLRGWGASKAALRPETTGGPDLLIGRPSG